MNRSVYNKDFLYAFKYIVIGNVGNIIRTLLVFIAVGKSCLTLSFTKDNFRLSH